MSADKKWRPGDVAKTAQGTVALCHETGRMIDQNGAPWSDTRFPENLHHLVVIDPEDREQVERFREIAYRWADQVPYADMREAGDIDHTGAMQAALREFIAEPEPEEPTGTGAVVRDPGDDLWVYVSRGADGAVWHRCGKPRVRANWSDIPRPLTVLSPGWEPEQ